MTQRCAFCHWSVGSPEPVTGWIEAIQCYLDNQPHPDRVVGLIECDRRVFEDDSWFAVAAQEPLAEGHVQLICKHHITGLSGMRGPTEDDVEPAEIEAARGVLLDDLIIAHDVVTGYDRRVVDAVVLSGTLPDRHLSFDVVPVYRFDHATLPVLAETASQYEDIPLPQKRRMWEERRQDFEDAATRLRQVSARVIRTRPGRRRAGLVAGDEY